MADRVFPNNINVDMGSKITFSGIDWGTVEANIKNNKFASDQSEEVQALLRMANEQMAPVEQTTKALTPEKIAQYRPKLIEALDKIAEEAQMDDQNKENFKAEVLSEFERNPGDEESIKNSIAELQKANIISANSGNKMQRTALMKIYLLMAKAMEDLMSQGMSEEEAEAEINKDISILENYRDMLPKDNSSPKALKDYYPDDYTPEFPESKNNFANSRKTKREAMKKIAFTHPSQISAEAIEKAKAAGDTKLVNTILAARKANRQRIAAAIAEKNEVSERIAQRNNILKLAQMDDLFDENEMMDDSTDNTMNDPMNDPMKKKPRVPGDLSLDAMLPADESEAPTLAFTSPTKFTKAQRASFAKIAKSLGMPDEYVKAMCTPVLSPETERLNREINEIKMSRVSEKTKNSLIKTLIKEAKLSTESKNEFIRYWNETLGYQDKQFYKDVAADYVDGKKVN